MDPVCRLHQRQRPRHFLGSEAAGVEALGFNRLVTRLERVLGLEFRVLNGFRVWGFRLRV